MRKSGDTVDRYVVESALGAGGMGQVYLALDPKLNRRVALKVLLADPGATDGTRKEWAARMLREARAAAGFNHPNAVAVYDVGEFEGAPYIAMELVQGTTLRARIGDASAAWKTRLGWLVDIARALGAAHRARIVHRDVKPDNVMVDASGVARILDFGIARSGTKAVDPTDPTEAAALGTLTERGTTVGTPRYMAPEQIKGDPLDGRTDQFSWGVMAYELFAGRLPWSLEGDALRLAAAILTSAPASLAELCPELPVEVAHAVERAMSKAPADRWAEMEDLVAVLEPHLGASSEKVRAVAPTATVATHGPRLDRRVLAAGVVVALLLLIGVVLGPRLLGLGAPTGGATPTLGESAVTVVLPFENLTRRAEDDWLGLGLAEAIQTKLAAVPGVHTLSFRPVAGETREGAVARARGQDAAVLVTGSYQRVGDDIRVTVRAEDLATPGRTLASDERRGTMAGIFDLQDELALGLVSRLRGDMPTAAVAEMRQRGTRNLEAFEAYAKGLAFLSARKMPEAMRELHRAIALDPSYAPAQSTLRKTRADTNHVQIGADGTVVQMIYQELPPDLTRDEWVMTTNVGVVTGAWDVAGNPLALRVEDALGTEKTYRITLPPRGDAGPGSAPFGLLFERRDSSRLRGADGIRLYDLQFETDTGGEQTFIVQLPPGAALLAVSPIPVESSDDDGGTFLLMREVRDPQSPYRSLALYAESDAARDRWREMSAAARRQWLVESKISRTPEHARELTEGSDPVLACALAKRGKVNEARELLRRVLAAPADHGAFLVARARACLARSDGDDAAALRELTTAVALKDRPADLVQDAYLEIIDLHARRGSIGDAGRVVLGELKRRTWWQPELFHRGDAATEKALEARHAAEPENDAVRRDLALLRMRAERLDDAQRLLEGREQLSARPYVLQLEAEVALRRGPPDASAAALRRLVAIFPAGWAWTSHVACMAQAGQAKEALDFLSEHAAPGPYELPVYRPLRTLVPALEDPLASKDLLVAFVAKAAEVEYGRPFRLELMVELIEAGSRSKRPARAQLVSAFVATYRSMVQATAPEVCGRPCLLELADRVCKVDGLAAEDRAWLRASSGSRCGG